MSALLRKLPSRTSSGLVGALLEPSSSAPSARRLGWAALLAAAATLAVAAALLLALSPSRLQASWHLGPLGSGEGGRLRIPRILHQVYIPDRAAYEAVAADPSSPLRAGWTESCRVVHAGWQHRFWGHAEAEELLRARYPWFLSVWQGFGEVVAKTDSIRPFIMHAFGGVYIDNDIECWRAFDSWLEGYDLVLQGTHPGEGHTNAVLASVPGHPFWLEVAQEIARRAAAGPLPDPATNPVAMLRRTTWAFRDVTRRLVGIPFKKVPPQHWANQADAGPNPFVGEWRLNGTLMRIYPPGQPGFLSPCWFDNNTCHREMALQRALGELPAGLAGFHRYTGTWNAEYNRLLGVSNREQAEFVLCDPRGTSRAAELARLDAEQRLGAQRRAARRPGGQGRGAGPGGGAARGGRGGGDGAAVP